MHQVTDILRVLVTLERPVVDDPGRLDGVCRMVEQHMSCADRSLLRFGILSGEIRRGEIASLGQLPGVQSVDIDESKSAVTR